MLPKFAHSYRCPACRGELAFWGGMNKTDREIRHGELHCPACGASYPVDRGIVRFVRSQADLDERKQREVEGWKSLTRSGDFPSNWDDLLLTMPNVPPADDATGYWRLAAMSYPVARAVMEPLHGARVLEIGAAYCWASRRFAESGAEVHAADINDDDWAGLGKADHFFNHGVPHFERVCCDAERLPFPDAWFDRVFCSSVIHHFERPENVLREIARVLKPGGRFVAMNEAYHAAWPLRRLQWDDLSGIVKQSIELGINEQTFAHREYKRYFESAGLKFDALLVRWDAVADESGMRLGRNIALKQEGFKFTRLERSAPGRLLQKLPLHLLLRFPPVAGLARLLALHYTGTYRILVGRKE